MPLRPMNIGELLEGALSFIRSNPRTILGLAAVLAAAVAVLQTLGLWASLAVLSPRVDDLVGTDVPAELSGDLSELLTTGLSQLLPGLVTSLLQVIASGLFTVLVGAAVLGRLLDAGRTWAALRPRLGPLLGLAALLVLGGILVIAVTAGVIALLVTALGTTAVLLAVLLVVVLLVGALFVYVRVAVAAPALVLEGVGPVTALRRSWRLVQGSWWRVLGILVLTGLIAGFLTTVVSVPVSLVTSALAGFEPSLLAVAVTSGVTALLTGIVTWPFTSAVTGLLYVDLRMRREGLDQRLVAAAAGSNGSGAGDANDHNPLVSFR